MPLHLGGLGYGQGNCSAVQASFWRLGGVAESGKENRRSRLPEIRLARHLLPHHEGQILSKTFLRVPSGITSGPEEPDADSGPNAVGYAPNRERTGRTCLGARARDDQNCFFKFWGGNSSLSPLRIVEEVNGNLLYLRYQTSQRYLFHSNFVRIPVRPTHVAGADTQVPLSAAVLVVHAVNLLGRDVVNDCRGWREN